MKIGRNEQCPCGSGKKSKKCCQAERPLSYTRAERTSARTKLLEYVDQHLVDEDDLALDEFWEPLDDLEDTNLNEHFSAVSEQVLDDWFVFDRQLATNETVVERFLAAEGPRLTRGERAHLEALKASTMRLYRVEELSPGESLTLVDLIEGGQVTVQEKLGSRSLHRFDALVARVVVPGASGKPELEGLLTIAQPWLEGLRAAVKQDRADDIAQHPGASLDPFYRSMPPHFHEVWARSILTPAVPRLANTDGEEMVVTRIHFSVLNRGALVDALEHSKLERGKGETWSWYGPNVKTTIHKYDLRAGGEWLNEMNWGGKSDFSKMSFQEVVPLQKMVWHHSSTDAGWNITSNPMMPDWPRTLLTTVTFEDKGSTTQVRLSQIPINPTEVEITCFANAMSRMDKGWGSGYKIMETILAELQGATL